MFNCFSVLNEKWISQNYRMYVQNVDALANHWGTTKYLARKMSELERKLSINQMHTLHHITFVDWLIELNQQNPKIEDMHFYADPDHKQTVVCVCVSDIKPPKNFLNRNIITNFHTHKQVLFISDVTLQEWEDVSNKIPHQWKTIEELTEQFNFYKNIYM